MGDGLSESLLKKTSTETNGDDLTEIMAIFDEEIGSKGYVAVLVIVQPASSFPRVRATRAADPMTSTTWSVVAYLSHFSTLAALSYFLQCSKGFKLCFSSSEPNAATS